MPGLEVRLKPVTRGPHAAEDAEVEAILENRAERAVRVSLAQLRVASLALEVRGPGREQVHLRPPPVPRPEDLEATDEVPPGGSLAVRYAGFLDRSLPPGRYHVRFIADSPALGASPGEPLISDWVTLRITEFPDERADDETNEREDDDEDDEDADEDDDEDEVEGCTEVYEEDVSFWKSETISNAPAGATAWNGTYRDHIRFHVTVSEADCTVKVTMKLRVKGAITAAQLAAWKSAIESKWSNKFKVCCDIECCPDGMPIVIDIVWVDSWWASDHTVNVGPTTTNTANWSATDTVDITHEFGHLIGNDDEYYTVNGVNFNGARKPGGNVMNNPAGDPAGRHFQAVTDAVGELLEESCPPIPVGTSCF